MQQIGQLNSDNNIQSICYDYYGKRLASVDQQGVVRIYSLEKDFELISTFQGQDNILCALWSHPRFGQVLITSGDNKVIVWKQFIQNQWQEIRSHTHHSDLVNTLALANEEYDFSLFSGSYDEQIILEQYQNDNWYTYNLQNSNLGGVKCLATCPQFYEDKIRIIASGLDSVIKIHDFLLNEKQFQTVQQIQIDCLTIQNIAWGGDQYLAIQTDQGVQIKNIESSIDQQLDFQNNVESKFGLQFDQKCQQLIVGVDKGIAIFSLAERWELQEILS